MKRPVLASFVKRLEHVQDDRGMTLIEAESRCVLRHEIHEIVTTDESDARPGNRVGRCGFLGFAEVESGGVVERGDIVTIDGRPLGAVLGFDECHWPNHYNVLIATPRALAGPAAGVRIGGELRFAAR